MPIITQPVKAAQKQLRKDAARLDAKGDPQLHSVANAHRKLAIRLGEEQVDDRAR
jgi:hypothetical protein